MAKTPRAKQAVAVKAAASPAPTEQAEPVAAEQAVAEQAEQAEPVPAEQAALDGNGVDQGQQPPEPFPARVYMVRSATPRIRRRAGIQFGPDPVEVDADALGDELFQQILDDPFLRTEIQ